MKIHNQALELDGTDMQATITSEPLYLGSIINCSFQIVYTGTPNGNFKLQASNDIVDSIKDVSSSDIVNWTDITGTTVNITSAGSHLYELEAIGYQWIRVVWTDSSSGDPSTITVANYFVKGL